jgi:hypothetical protein
MSRNVIALDPAGAEAGVFRVAEGADLEDGGEYEFVWPNGIRERYRVKLVGERDEVGGRLPSMARFDASAGAVFVES